MSFDYINPRRKERPKDGVGTQKVGAKTEQALSEYRTGALARFVPDLVARDDADEMIAHLPGEVSENVAPPGGIDTEHRSRENSVPVVSVTVCGVFSMLRDTA